MSSIWLIVRKSLRHHAFSTSLTVLSLSLACSLIMSVLVIQEEIERSFRFDNAGFDAVLGARGSKLQLVMNSVYHLETSPGNIPWSLYQKVKNIPMTELAVPYAVGDNYYGFRIVGTTLEFFEKFELRKGEKIQMQFGKPFDPNKKEAVVGSFVAESLDLKVGDVIQPYHGIDFIEEARHDVDYIISGIMKPTKTPADQVVWIPIDGFFRMEGHILRGNDGEVYTPKENEAIPDEHKEVSAVMLKFKSPLFGMRLAQQINNQGKVATLAYPIAAVMLDFMHKLGWILLVLKGVAMLTIIVVLAGTIASLYNTMNERRREFAILRALGAKRSTVFMMIMMQSLAMSILGIILGFLIYLGIMQSAAHLLKQEVGIYIEIFNATPNFFYGPLLMLGIGLISGILPAIKAYRTEVSVHLSPQT